MLYTCPDYYLNSLQAVVIPEMIFSCRGFIVNVIYTHMQTRGTISLKYSEEDR